MQHPGGFGEEKIMHEGPVAQHRLGADAGNPGFEILERQTWAIFAALGKIALLP